MTDGPEPRRHDAAKYVAIAAALLIAAVGAFVVLLPADAPEIGYRVIAIQLGDPDQVVVTFDVEKAPLATAECQVTATGENNDIVNRLTGIVVGPSPGRRVTRHTVTVRTDQPATDAAVATCAITRQG